MSHPNLTSDENKALAELKEILKKLVDKRLMIFNLYGSKAKGDYDSESDTDIAIIVRGLSKEQNLLNVVHKRIFTISLNLYIKNLHSALSCKPGFLRNPPQQ